MNATELYALPDRWEAGIRRWTGKLLGISWGWPSWLTPAHSYDESEEAAEKRRDRVRLLEPSGSNSSNGAVEIDHWAVLISEHTTNVLNRYVMDWVCAGHEVPGGDEPAERTGGCGLRWIIKAGSAYDAHRFSTYLQQVHSGKLTDQQILGRIADCKRWIRHGLTPVPLFDREPLPDSESDYAYQRELYGRVQLKVDFTNWVN